MTRWIVALALCLACGSGIAQTRTSLDGRTSFERRGPDVWSLADGVCGFGATHTEATLITLGRDARSIVVEAAVSIGGLPATSALTYGTAGLALDSGVGNDWRLLLVVAPDGRRYPELIERLDGVHQAQTGAHSPSATLEATITGELAEWQPERTYHLTLALSPDAVRGAVRDVETGEVWEKSFVLTGRAAVRSGRAALTASSLSGAFEAFSVIADADDQERIVAEPGPAGAVLVVQQTPPTVEVGPLADALQGRGYSVAMADWRDLEEAEIAFEQWDAVVVADARTMSLRLRDELLAGLHSGGRMILIGAPAMSDLVILADDRYVDEQEWIAHLAASVEREIIDIGPDTWLHGASDAARRSTLLPIPGDDSGWAGECDLDNWDTYSAPVKLAADYDALVFEARGGGPTTHIVLELIESDGSRWLTAIEVGEDWRSYVLRPADFGYWTDSQSVGRGGAGDVVRLAGVARFGFGLAKSHAPTLASGPHAYQIKGLSTARLGERSHESFGVPDIEAVSPSYNLYPVDGIAAPTPALDQHIAQTGDARPLAPAFSPIWRERGRGIHRGRAARWAPLVQTGNDVRNGRNSVVSMVIGDAQSPGAVWANFATSDPADVWSGPLQGAAVEVIRALSRGAFLLEAGAEQFAYADGEPTALGAEITNAGRAPFEVTVRCTVTDSSDRSQFSQETLVALAPGERTSVDWEWSPAAYDDAGYEVSVTLWQDGLCVDRIEHRIARLRTEPARPEELVRLVDRDFELDGKPWRFLGINYWPSWVAGCGNMTLNTRDRYDPEIIERDLAWLESVGVNAIGAVAALRPHDPDAPMAYRDQLDFLGRCAGHGIKVHFTLPSGRPYADADVTELIDYIGAAGLRDHPAIVSWELAWEPIHGPWNNGLDVFLDDWNAWVVQRYGSVEAAINDWGYDPRGPEGGVVPVPTTQQCTSSGEWDVYVSAFRRAFSDLISRAYGEIARALRAYDPNHLVSFRGGACGIPSGAAFAHIHSVGVAKHMDYLNPEGYSLQPWTWLAPTPADDIRKGGLITLYYRFISREKPVVWMEFGYSVRGLNTRWSPDLVYTSPDSLADQREELENFYAMMVESGAKGAAPWWLPGGFRVGENSDFGLLEPDGRERPSCEVLTRYNAILDTLQTPQPTQMIDLDLDLHDPTAWQRYSAEYLAAAMAGETPGLRTAGTGTDSTTCPLTAVGGHLYNGHNPLTFLNSEYNSLEARIGEGEWFRLDEGALIGVTPGESVRCRASVGNLGEAGWVAPGTADDTGAVYLAGRAEYGLEFQAPIEADTPYLQDAVVPEFVLLTGDATTQAADQMIAVSIELLAQSRAYFGERRTVHFTIGAL